MQKAEQARSQDQLQLRNAELKLNNLMNIRVLEREEVREIQDELRSVGKVLDLSLKRLLRFASTTSKEYYT